MYERLEGKLIWMQIKNCLGIDATVTFPWRYAVQSRFMYTPCVKYAVETLNVVAASYQWADYSSSSVQTPMLEERGVTKLRNSFASLSLDTVPKEIILIVEEDKHPLVSPVSDLGTTRKWTFVVHSTLNILTRLWWRRIFTREFSWLLIQKGFTVVHNTSRRANKTRNNSKGGVCGGPIVGRHISCFWRASGKRRNFYHNSAFSEVFPAWKLLESYKIEFYFIFRGSNSIPDFVV